MQHNPRPCASWQRTTGYKDRLRCEQSEESPLEMRRFLKASLLGITWRSRIVFQQCSKQRINVSSAFHKQS